jgi:MFS family permease
MALLSFLDRELSVAHRRYSRWSVPPVALAIHLCIGQAYAFSVFKIPLSQALGITKSIPGDWTQSQLAWIFSLAIAILGLSAAVFGKWLEGAGPRKAMFASAVCFALGFFISYFGVIWHQLWLIYFGYGFVGGIGLSLGYISPVSTLVKWFPDRPGLATGMAIMGFGGGAMIGSPLAIKLMAYFRTPNDVGVGPTFLVMGVLYFLLMMFGVFTIRVPREDWKPENWTPQAKDQKLITTHNVDVNTAFKTPQFWLLWIVLCTNVTAGIGILEQASPMIQELFKGAVGLVAAGGFVGLLSLFNMAGRFFWASTSDYIGRRPTYFIFFTLGAALYFFLPRTSANYLNSVCLFVGIAVVLLSMYGGGFATIPAYLRDRRREKLSRGL